MRAAIAPASAVAAGLAHAGAALRRAGFDERAVCAFYGVPLCSDTHHAAPPPGRVRRGLGAAVALLVAGEEVARSDVAILDDAALGALQAAGLLDGDSGRLRARASITPFLGALVATDRVDDHGASAVRPPDLSAWNVAACLPPGATPLVDAGCGAGAILLAAAGRGSEVVGFDVDGRALDFAAINVHLNDLPAGRVRLLSADVRSPPPGTLGPGTTCVFNAPLVRAPMAGSLAGNAPLYLHAPGSETLPVAFFEACRKTIPHGGELLCHTQLTDAVWEAAVDLGAPSLVALLFARSPDGTPHALMSLRREPTPAHRARFRTPLGPALPHLRRELLDRLHAGAALAASDEATVAGAVLRPAPWLRLERSEQHDGHAFRPREVRFGEAILDEDEVALLARCDGRRVAEAAPDAADARRLRDLLERGLLVP